MTRRTAGLTACAALVALAVWSSPAKAQIRAGLVNLTSMVTGVLPGANGGTGVANSGKTLTLSGNLTTTGAFNPTIAVPSSSTWTLPSGGGTLGVGDALVASPLSQFASTTSAQLAGVLSNETGSNLAVFNTAPTLQTSLTLTGATETTSNPVLNATQTWNASGTTFTGWLFNATNTASASASNFLDFQLSGTSILHIQKDGQIFGAQGTVSNQQRVLIGGLGSWTGGGNGWELRAGNVSTNQPNFKVSRSDGSDIFGADAAGLYVAGKLQLGNGLTNGDTCLHRNAAGVVEFTNCTANTYRDVVMRHAFAQGTAPTVANTTSNSCGTTAATITGRDELFKVTVGATSGTSCTVTFGTAYPNAPGCWAKQGGTYIAATETTTTVVLSGTFAAGDVLTGGCKGFS